MDKDYKNFLKAIVKLEPIEFLGLARFLNIKLTEEVDGQTKERDALEILYDIGKKYSELNRKQKRTLFKMLHTTTK